MANMGDGSHNTPVIKDRWGIRKLTPKECARLQGYKDDWFSFPEGRKGFDGLYGIVRDRLGLEVRSGHLSCSLMPEGTDYG
jgi:hypothetical protein